MRAEPSVHGVAALAPATISRPPTLRPHRRLRACASGLASVLVLLALILPSAARAQDRDGDGMPDAWEAMNGCLMGNTPDGNIDFDGDGLTSLAEYTYSPQMNPCFPDTDMDGAMDGFEVSHGSNPLDNRVRPMLMFNLQSLVGENRISWPGSADRSALAWTGSSFTLVWSDDRFGFMTSELFSTTLGLRGDTLGPELRLTPGAVSFRPKVVRRGSELGLAWFEPYSTPTAWFVRLAADGSTAGPVKPAAAGSPDAIAWTGSEFGFTYTPGGVRIDFQRLTADGDTIGPALTVTPVASMYDPALAFGVSEFGLAWRNDIDREIYFERLLADGTTTGPELRVTNDTFNDSQPSLAWNGSEFGLVWSDRRNGLDQIYFNRVSPSGSLVGSDVRVVNSLGNSDESVLVWAPELNEYGLVYTDNGGSWRQIFFLRLGVNGNLVDGPIQVSTGPSGAEYPTLAWTGSYFGISWTDSRIFPPPKNKIYFSLLGTWSDSDGDMLTDFNELTVNGTDPGNWDTDHDGMPDGWENMWAFCGLNPLDADSTGDPDGDLLSNLQEYTLGSSPCFPDDRDGDGMSDGYELRHSCLNMYVYDAYLDGDSDGLFNLNEKVLGADPCDNDTDNDGMTDGFEANHACLFPLVGDSTADPDGEGLKNLAEFNANSNPCVPDTDGDGLSDYAEVVVYHSNPRLPNSDGDAFSDWIEVMVFGTDPAVYDFDTDLDGLPDAVETGTGNFIDPTDAGTNPLKADTDSDGFNDYDEIFVFFTDPNSFDADSDGDGLPDVVETNTGVYVDLSDTGTNPNAADTDGDGVNDRPEIMAGSNPFERLVVPGPLAPERVGTDLRVTSDPGVSGNPDLSWTGSEYALAWQDARGANSPEIYFHRISASGSLLGSEVRVSFNATSSEQPALAWAPGLGEYGVIWDDMFDDQNGYCDTVNWPYDCNYELYFQRVGPTGTLIGAPTRITSSLGATQSPSLVWTGSEYGAAYIDDTDGTPDNFGHVYFVRIAGNGAPVLPRQLVYNCTGDQCYAPSLAWSGLDFGLGWGQAFGTINFMLISTAGTPSGTDLNLGLGAVSLHSTVWAGNAYAAAWGNAYTGGSSLMARIAGGVVIDPGDSVSTNGPSMPAWTGSEYGLAINTMWGGFLFREVAADGRPISPELHVSGPNPQIGKVVSAGSEFGLAWSANNEIYFTRLAFAYDSDGDGLSARREAALGTDPGYWDTDGDGLPDGFEQHHLACLNPLALDSTTADPDGDLADNLAEFHNQSDPCVFSDADADGMPDAWEAAHGCMEGNTADAAADYDGDFIQNLDEYLLGSDPCGLDSDGDGLPDSYEQQYSLCGLNLVSYGPGLDHDMDGLSDLAEFTLGTIPCDPDSDDDLMPDGWEADHACTNPLVGDSLADPDGDALANRDELAHDTDPCVGNNGDTDGDGISDTDEVLIYGTDPFVPDTDGDGLSDGEEVNVSSTNPLDPDSDHDGVSDGAEVADGTDPNNPASFVRFGTGLVNYQGRLSNTAGVAYGGTAAMNFAVFGAASGGTALWTESRQVGVVNGIYNLVLGGDTAIPAGVMAGTDLFLEIKVNGQTLAPRSPITADLTALNADRIAGRRLETGARTLAVNPAVAVKVVHVAFAMSFAGPPRVVVSSLDGPIGAQAFVNTRTFNVTATGFDVEWRSLSGAADSGSAGFGYTAVGE